MRRHDSGNPKRADRRHGGPLRMLASEQGGFTIIEVVVSALIIAALAGATATALTSTNSFSGDQRARSGAQAIAQQDQERIRNMSISQLATLNQVRNVGPYNGTTYKVTSTGNYLSSTGNSTCASAGVGAAAYVKIRSEVDWAANHSDKNVNNVSSRRRPPIVQETLITQSNGGTLLVYAKDQLDAPLAGVTIDIAGQDFASGTTSSEGCVVFGGIETSGYYVWGSKSGFVDPNGNANPVRGASVSGSGTSFPSPDTFRLGQAGAIIANFKAVSGGTTYTSHAPSISWFNSGMTASKDSLVGASGSPPKVQDAQTVLSWVWGEPFNLYPFTTGPGSYTGNYTVWAGNCDDAKPTSNQTLATVPPGQAADLNDGGSPVQPRILLPGLNVTVQWNTGGAPTNVPESQVAAAKITHQGCNETWWAETGAPTGSPTPPNPPGVLKHPGQPFAPDVANKRLAICVEYSRNGGSTYFHNDAAVVTPNTNFAALHPVTINVNESLPANAGRCPV
jgi:Tfp pilus assembly protein PilV